jgi:hypothetical protein
MSLNRFCLRAFLCVLCAFSAGAQSVSLAGLDIRTYGWLEDDYDPAGIAEGTVAGRFVPADWIRFKASAAFLSYDAIAFMHPSPEKNEPGILAFTGASVNLPELYGSPLNFSAFTGLFDDPAGDSLSRDLLKTRINEPEFLSMPVGRGFRSETWIQGTGLAMTANPLKSASCIGLYAYWNTLTGDDSAMTGDIRFARSDDLYRVNLFAGYTSGQSDPTQLMRGGLSSVLISPAGNELYVGAGLRATKPDADKIAKDLYFVFENRLIGESADLSFAFFSAPSEYGGNAGTYLGLNALAGFGNLRRSGIRGGVSLLASVDPAQPKEITPFTFSVSPFCGIMIGDFLLNMTIVINPLLLDDPETMGQIQIGFKAVL